MIASLLLLSFLSTVDSTEITQTSVELDPIIVTAKREPTRLSKIVNSAILISHKQISNIPDENILSVFDKYNSSIMITSNANGGYGLGTRGQGKIMIRGMGFSPNRGVLVLTDGRPDIAGLFGHPLPDTYRKPGIYSAELIKGAASTLYGSNAVGGVIELTSFYRPDIDKFAKVELTSGSFDTFDGNIQYSQKHGDYITAGWYDYEQTDNQRINNEYLNRSGGVRIQFPSYNGYDFFFAGKLSSYEFTDPGPDYNLSPFSGDILRSGATIGIDKSTTNYSLSLRTFNNYGEHQFSDGFNSIDRLNGLDIFGRLKNISQSGLNLSGGLSVNRLSGSASNGTPFINGGSFHEDEYSAQMQSDYQLNEGLNFSVSGRFINHSEYSSHFVYNGGIVYSPKNIGSFKLSAGTSYRNPTINEAQLFLISNSDSLKPEEGQYYEFGYFNKINSELSVESAVFYMEGNNLIQTVFNPAPPPPAYFANSGSYSQSGWEMGIVYSKNIYTVNSSFSHLNLSDYNSSVPEDRININLSAANQKFSAHLSVIAAFKTHSDSAGTLVILDDYTIANFDVSYNLGEIVNLKLLVKNIFDNDYQQIHGYPMAGINFRSTISFILK